MPIYDAPEDYLGKNRHRNTIYLSASLPRWSREKALRTALKYPAYGDGAWKLHAKGITYAIASILELCFAILLSDLIFRAQTTADCVAACVLTLLWGGAGIYHAKLLIQKYFANIIRENRVRRAKIDMSTVVAVDIKNDDRWTCLEKAWKRSIANGGSQGVSPAKGETLEQTLRSNREFCRAVEPTIDHYYRSSDTMHTEITKMIRLGMRETKPYKKLTKSLAKMTKKTVADMILVMNMQQSVADEQKAMALENHRLEVGGLVAQANFFLSQDPIIP